MVFFITGFSGSGKTTVAEFFQQVDIPVIRMGDVTERSLAQSGERQEEAVRRRLREQYGLSVYAERTLPYIALALSTSQDVVVEGVRSRQEWKYFQKNLKDLCLIYVQTEKEIRHRRLTKREIRPLSDTEIQIRDGWEQEIQVEKLKNVADYVVENNSSRKELYKTLDRVTKKYLLDKRSL